MEWLSEVFEEDCQSRKKEIVMGHQIIKQPNGMYCVYSSIVDEFIITDASPEEIIGHWIAIESDKLTKKVNDIVSELNAGGRPYHQFTMTFEEAVAQAKEVHGEKWQPPKEAYEPLKYVSAFPKGTTSP